MAMEPMDIRSATVVEAVKLDPSDHLSFTVRTPDEGEFYVEGRCIIGGKGSVTIEVDDVPAFRQLYGIDDDSWHDLTATGRVRRDPGVEVRLRMVIDGTYRIEPLYPATLRAMPFRPEVGR
jgi:hypothetical protein